jgi:hypothetical protein
MGLFIAKKFSRCSVKSQWSVSFNRVVKKFPCYVTAVYVDRCKPHHVPHIQEIMCWDVWLFIIWVCLCISQLRNCYFSVTQKSAIVVRRKVQLQWVTLFYKKSTTDTYFLGWLSKSFIIFADFPKGCVSPLSTYPEKSENWLEKRRNMVQGSTLKTGRDWICQAYAYYWMGTWQKTCTRTCFSSGSSMMIGVEY